MSKKLIVFFMAISISMISGCSTTKCHHKTPPQKNKVIMGTAIGATAGLITGGFVSEPLAGALIGGGFGALIGHHHKDSNTAIHHQHQITKQGTDIVKLKHDHKYSSTTIHHQHQITKHGTDIIKLKHNQRIFILPSDGIFKINTPHLKPNAYLVLNEIVSLLKESPNQNIHISSNTDPVLDQYQFKGKSLSLQQVEQIAGYLWEKGIRQGPTHRHLTYSANEAIYPIATNKKLSGMTTNRRIQIIVYSNTMKPYPKSTPKRTKKYTW